LLNEKWKNKFRNDRIFFKVHKIHKVSPNLQQAPNIWFEWTDNCLNKQHVLSKNFLNETLWQYMLLIQKENNKVVPFLMYVGYFFITWSYISKLQWLKNKYSKDLKWLIWEEPQLFATKVWTWKRRLLLQQKPIP
jgi:hypothetical protein